MPEYIVRSAFSAKCPTGEQLLRKGEVLRLSSSKASALVLSGYIVDVNVGLDPLVKYEARVKVLREKVGYTANDAQIEAEQLVTSCLKRHEATKTLTPPSKGFLAEVEELNRTSTGSNPVSPIPSDTGAGEWAGYRCNIGNGCAHGCLYCYAEKMASRFDRIQSAEAWREEVSRDSTTRAVKRYSAPIMFPTTHDITPAYLPAYRAHLYNLLEAGNTVLLVSKPHLASIQAICSEFSSFRDNMMFRFTIGGLNGEVMNHWEPGAPLFEERLRCLKYAFERGYTTSVSAEPMLGGRHETVKLYYLLEPFITKEIWFGKMNNIGGFRASEVAEVARHATELTALQTNDEIMELVGSLDGKPKVQWKDSIKELIAKRTGATTNVNGGLIK